MFKCWIQSTFDIAEEKKSIKKTACIGDNIDRLVQSCFRKWSRRK